LLLDAFERIGIGGCIGYQAVDLPVKGWWGSLRRLSIYKLLQGCDHMLVNRTFSEQALCSALSLIEHALKTWVFGVHGSPISG
jgi:hypothetical protein